MEKTVQHLSFDLWYRTNLREALRFVDHCRWGGDAKNPATVLSANFPFSSLFPLW